MNNVFEKSNYLVRVGLRPDLKPAWNSDWARGDTQFWNPQLVGPYYRGLVCLFIFYFGIKGLVCFFFFGIKGPGLLGQAPLGQGLELSFNSTFMQNPKMQSEEYWIILQNPSVTIFYMILEIDAGANGPINRYDSFFFGFWKVINMTDHIKS